jgi:hypothetical protein
VEIVSFAGAHYGMWMVTEDPRIYTFIIEYQGALRGITGIFVSENRIRMLSEDKSWLRYSKGGDVYLKRIPL